MTDRTSKPRVSDSELAGEIANLERLRLNPTGLSTREAYVLLALYELSNRRAFETTGCAVGVGDGSGNLLVHGSYEAVRRGVSHDGPGTDDLDADDGYHRGSV